MHIDFGAIGKFLWENKEAVVGVVATVVGYFWPRLPWSIQSILSKIGGNEYVIAIIKDTNMMRDKTDSEKRQIVADEIIAQAAKFGLKVSQTNALYIVQVVYKKYKDITT